VFIVAITTHWLVGYYFGKPKQRTRVLTTVVALLVASVMWLIMDLDQPTRGVIRASQQSWIEVHQDLSQEPVEKSF
jgi:hypothetical protein